MTRSSLHSAESTSGKGDGIGVAPGLYESSVWIESRACRGVRFRVLRMSLLRRHRLMQELIVLVAKQQFHAAKDDPENEMAAAELRRRIDQRVIRSALIEVEGLSINGRPATVESLLEEGSEELANEIAEAITSESFLSEEERKN